MDENLTIQHFYWGKFVDSNTPRGDFRIVATTPDLTDQEVNGFLSQVYLGSHELIDIAELTHAYSFVSIDSRVSVFAHIRPSRVADRGHKYPVYHVLVIRTMYLQHIGLRELVAAVGTDPNAPDYDEFTTTLVPINIPLGKKNNKLESSEGLFQWLKKLKIQTLMEFLDNLLEQGTSIIIRDIPNDPSTRLDFIQTLWALMPHNYSPALSFCTQAFDSNARFKITCPYAKTYRVAVADVIVDFETLTSNKINKNYYQYSKLIAKWISTVNSWNEILRKIQTVEVQIELVAELYPELNPFELLEIVSVNRIIFEADGSQKIDKTLLITAIEFHRLLSVKDEKTLSLKLFQLGFETQEYGVWYPLLTNRLIIKYEKLFRKILKNRVGEEQLALALVYWSQPSQSDYWLDLFWLFGSLNRRFLDAISTDHALVLRIVDACLKNEEYEILLTLLNHINDENQIDDILYHVTESGLKMNKLDYAFSVVKATKVPNHLKKAFYMRLIDLFPQNSQDIAIELLRPEERFVLLDEEKWRLLWLDLPNPYKNQISIDLITSIFTKKTEENNYLELSRLLELYLWKPKFTEEIRVLLSDQDIHSFFISSRQVLTYLKRVKQFSDILNISSDTTESLTELKADLASLSESEYVELCQIVSELGELLEPKGRLAKSSPIVTALRRLSEVISSR